MSSGKHSEVETLVIGAGPAGLAAAHRLSREGRRATVLEADSLIGGLARTVEHHGFRFDIGGHRFYTKVARINALWEELLGDKMMTRQRLSRIFYRGKLLEYPLRAGDALRALGVGESAAAIGSYFRARLAPLPGNSFEAWMINRFGRRLYQHFFKTYTEKVWGMPCSEISADWAAQRIRSLSLWGAIVDAVSRKGGSKHTTLIQQFRYPRLGPGMMWERCRQLIEGSGNQVLTGQAATRVLWEGRRVRGVVAHGPDGDQEYPADFFVSSMPLRQLLLAMDPPPPEEVLAAARALRFRGMMCAGLIVNHPLPFPEQWIYIHSQDVRMVRLQNYKNWSPEMVPDAGKSCLGVEYLAWPDEEFWQLPDEAILAQAAAELDKIGLVKADSVEDGILLRMPGAYPVYDPEHRERMATIRKWLDGLENLYTVGRNGQHRYNNMDHAMLTGILAAENILGAGNDVWAVNTEQSYVEGG